MKNYLTIFILTIAIFSCKKDNETPIETLKVEDFQPYAIGNNWTYDRYTVQADGTEELRDTEVITISNSYTSGDTTFVEVAYSNSDNGLSRSLIPEKFYLLNGEIVVLNSDFPFLSTQQGDTLSQQIIGNVVEIVTYMNTETLPLISVPAGDFQESLIQQVTESRFFDPDYQYENPRFTYTYYEKGVGCILRETFYASSPETIRWKLRSFEIN